MALQESVLVRNARLDAIETQIGASAVLKIFSGAVTANCAAADPTGLLVTMSLPADWMAAAGAGAKAKLGAWSGTASGGAGTTPQSFRIYATDGTTCGMQGTCGIGSGDLSVDGTITSGQTVTVSSFSITAGNA